MNDEEQKGGEQGFPTYERLNDSPHQQLNTLPHENSLFLDKSLSQNEHGIQDVNDSFLGGPSGKLGSSMHRSILGLSSLAHARKLRGDKEKDVRQLHTRITIL